MRDQPLREIERVALRVGDDAGAADPPGRLLGLQRAHFVAAQAHRRRRDQRVAVVRHPRDQRLDEARRGQQRIALEVDHQVDVARAWPSASAQRSVPLRHSGEVMITAAPKPSAGSAMRSSSVTTWTDRRSGTRRAASMLRWISGLASPPAPLSSTSGLPG